TLDEDLQDSYRNASIIFDKVTDNLGNTYTIEDNGGVSNDSGRTLTASATLNAIDPQATTLTLTPIAIYAGLESGPIAKEHKMEPITLQLK
ncbi:MAG TPA: DUF5643 domain-containing protein, partial [Metalysinibacillus sp.]